jgi:hypothetical protein
MVLPEHSRHNEHFVCSFTLAKAIPKVPTKLHTGLPMPSYNHIDHGMIPHEKQFGNNYQTLKLGNTIFQVEKVAKLYIVDIQLCNFSSWHCWPGGSQ